MKEMDDEQLVAQFFKSEAFEVADNGFSHRVSRSLPQRRLWLSRIWTVVCAVACVAFLWFTNAKEQALMAMERFVNELSRLVPVIHFSWSTVAVVIALIITVQWVIVHELASSEGNFA